VVQSKIHQVGCVGEDACQRLKPQSNVAFFQEQSLQAMEHREFFGFFL
jgi:hypothetical protein